MFKFIFALVAIITMLSMNYIGEVGKLKTHIPERLESTPVIIEANGSLSFPGRIPPPETILQLRRAIQIEDVEKINELLYANHLFIAPIHNDPEHSNYTKRLLLNNR